MSRQIGYVVRKMVGGSFLAVAVNPGPGVPRVVEAETLADLADKLREALERRQPDGRRTRAEVRVSSFQVVREVVRA
jgi:hypothetical protein